MNSIIAKVKKIALEKATALNLELIDVEWVNEFGTFILRITADTEVGLTIDESAALNEAISEALDEFDFIEEEYMLEVSSPGIERELKTEEDIQKAAQIMIEKGVKELIVTLGSKGSLYINKEKSMFKKAYKVEAVDTTAAGDSYTGALAVAFSKNESIEEAMDFASKVGALSVMKEGAQTSLPTLEDVLNFKGANK